MRKVRSDPVVIACHCAGRWRSAGGALLGCAASCAPACRSPPAPSRPRPAIGRHRRARRARHPHDPGHLARRRGPGHRLRPRAGPLLPDGSGAPPRGGRAGRARRRRRRFRLDREVRVHRFRDEARRTLALMAPRDRTVLEAYAAGVNRGLAVLGARPFEYLILRQSPQPWPAEDSLLVVLSMFVTLQDPTARYESTLATMRDVLPPEMFDLLAPRGTEWDSPIARRAVHDAPGARARGLQPAAQAQRQSRDRSRRAPRGCAGTTAATRGRRRRGDAALGSNSWAVSRRPHRRRAARSLANDMHLDIRVPNTWYRAVLEWRDEADASQTRLLAGLTLPGHPTLVAGSNTHVAWGFTNAQTDTGDLVLLELDPDGPQPVLDAVGLARPSTTTRETIEVTGGSRGDDGRALDHLGTGARHRSQGPAAGLRLDGALGRAARRVGVAARSRRGRSKRRSTPPTRSARRRRTSSWPTAAAASAGRSTARCRAASASTAGSPNRGPTAGAAGTAG